MRIVVDEQKVEAAVLGGSVLGGGGGGDPAFGRDLGYKAISLGRPTIIDIDDLSPEELLVTVAAVGPPAGGGTHATADNYISSAKLLIEYVTDRISGFISNESGGLASINGWIQSAALGLPVVDAPCNGRAHPIGEMGSLGLNRLNDFKSIQAVVAGSKETAGGLQFVAEGNLIHTSQLVRHASQMAKGLVAVARNPVSVRYVKDHAAPGAVKQSIRIGQAMLRYRDAGPDKMIEVVREMLGGTIACKGKVKEKKLQTSIGLDIGEVKIMDKQEHEFCLTFCNEYMTVEVNELRIATFPDLIVTFDVNSGHPLQTSQIEAGQEVSVMTVSRSNLSLGAGMSDWALIEVIEGLIEKKLVKYYETNMSKVTSR